jgi:DNA-binding Lrp family transcriptional regulator
LPEAYVLINTDLGDEKTVVNALRKVDGVKETFTLYGTYAILASVAADTFDRLKDLINSGVRKMEKIESTLTLMTLEEEKVQSAKYGLPLQPNAFFLDRLLHVMQPSLDYGSLQKTLIQTTPITFSSS